MQHLFGSVLVATGSWVGDLFAGVGSVIVLGVFLPFAASFTLDGLVVLMRRGRVRGVVVGILSTVVVWSIGLALSTVGASVASPAARAGFQRDIAMLLPLSSLIALLGFIARQVKR